MSSYFISLRDDGSGNFTTVIRRGGSAPTGGTLLQIPHMENNNAASPLVISAATNATPIVCTTATHGFSVGDVVTITGALGNTAANGTWVLSAVTGTTFTLTDSVGNGTYTANSGYVNKQVTTKGLYTAAQAAIRAALDDRAAGN